MRKIGCGLALALMLGCCAAAQETAKAYRVGGGMLALPAPPGDFVEAGERLQAGFFELLAPEENRRIAVFGGASVVRSLQAGQHVSDLGPYGMIEISRRDEVTDCTAQAFEETRNAILPALAKAGSDNSEVMQAAMSERLKSLDTEKIEFGRPEMLGPLFAAEDRFGYGMLTSYMAEGRTVVMAAGVGEVRVKQRRLYAYLYRRYAGAETMDWIRTRLEAWTAALVKANP